MIGRMTVAQRQALVALLGQLRPDWDLPGIRAAVERATEIGPATDVAVAACRIAGNRDALTPGLIPLPGNHWQGTTTGSRPVPMACVDHPTEPAGRCRQCVKEAVPPDAVADYHRRAQELHHERAEAKA